MNSDWLPILGKYTFTVIGIGVMIGAYFLYKNINTFIQESETSMGKVVNSVMDEEGMFQPVIEFKTHEGQTIIFESKYGSKPPAFKEGQVVEVLYNPALPEQAEINSFLSLWLGLLIVGPLGVLFFVVGMGSIIFGKR